MLELTIIRKHLAEAAVYNYVLCV